MAKLSSINKNERRKKLAKKYAGQYAKLKAIANDKSRDETERLIARLLSQVPPVADHAPGIGQQRPDPRSDQVELVRAKDADDRSIG